jgi:hypothetical protein
MWQLVSKMRRTSSGAVNLKNQAFNKQGSHEFIFTVIMALQKGEHVGVIRIHHGRASYVVRLGCSDEVRATRQRIPKTPMNCIVSLVSGRGESSLADLVISPSLLFAFPRGMSSSPSHRA